MISDPELWLMTWEGDECVGSYGFTHSDNFGSKGVGGAALLHRSDKGHWSRMERFDAACQEFITEIGRVCSVSLEVWGSVVGEARQLLWVCPECRTPLPCNWLPDCPTADELEEDEDDEWSWGAIRIVGEHAEHTKGGWVEDERSEMWGALIDRDLRGEV